MSKKKAADSGASRSKAAKKKVSQNRGKISERSLANLKPFKPGQSGNPGGRPKRDLAAEIAQAIFEGNAEAIAKAMLKSLKRGNPKTFSAMAERAYGKVAQHVEIGGEVSHEMKVTWVNVDALDAP